MSDLQDLMEKIEVKEKRSLQSSKNFATAQQMDQVATFIGKNRTMIFKIKFETIFQIWKGRPYLHIVYVQILA